jgi:small conductance mechanosensitive channel
VSGGSVKKVHLAFTMLTKEDGEIIHNSQAGTVLELSVGNAYESDTKVAIEAIRKKLAGMDGLSQTRSVQIGIDSFDDSSISLEIRCWVKTEQLYEVRFSSNQLILDSLKEAGVQIPFPQREVRVLG